MEAVERMEVNRQPKAVVGYVFLTVKDFYSGSAQASKAIFAPWIFRSRHWLVVHKDY
jgi:hypothetical protein